MKRKLLGTLAVLGLIYAGGHATAASKGSLFLVGKVKVVVDLYVIPVLGALDTLDIENGETGRKVADVEEKTNNKNGYRIDMESVNAGNLQHNDGTSQVAYTIGYNGAAAVSPGAVGSPVTVKTVSGPLTGGVNTNTSVVNIDVTAGGTTLPSGAYTDTLIFTIVAL